VAAREQGPDAIVLSIGGSLARGDISHLCDRARALLESSDAGVVVCDVGSLVDPDAVTVEALARLQLTAHRLGHRVRLRRACEELRELLALMGLGEVLPPCPDSGVEPGRQPEQGKEAGGVQEEGDPGDAAP
jgi:ABC-type transporter Mla MlaB component